MISPHMILNPTPSLFLFYVHGPLNEAECMAMDHHIKDWLSERGRVPKVDKQKRIERNKEYEFRVWTKRTPITI